MISAESKEPKRVGHLQVSRLIPASAAEVYEHISNLEGLPFCLEGDFTVEFPCEIPKLKERTEFELELSRWGVVVHVWARVEEMVPAQKFSYRQVSGFFDSWTHAQVLRAHGPKKTLLTDLVEFRLPGGILGAVLDDLVVCRNLEGVLRRRLLRIDELFSSVPGGRRAE